MKKLFVVLFLLFTGICLKSGAIDVIPVSMSANNAYGFIGTSEIIAREAVDADNKFSLNRTDLKFKTVVSNRNNAVNLKVIKEVAQDDKTLVVMTYSADKNKNRFDVWDILKISSDFDIKTPPIMYVKAVLVDNKEGVILWQKTYEEPLGVFTAKNMTEAIEKREKITSYARNIIAQDIVQNINLRLNPKKIDYASRVPQSSGVQEGIGLKYKNNAPVVKITPADDESFEERWRNDDSFNL